MFRIENQNQVASVTSRLLSPEEFTIVTGGTGGAADNSVDVTVAGSEDPDPGT